MNKDLIDNKGPSAGEPEDIRILILDDESCISELLGELLEIFGYTSRQCNSPHEALSLIGQERFDIILSDYRMPQMNGQEFYRAAVERHPHLARRIVFLTGDVVSEEIKSFLQSTGNLHLAKPFQAASVDAVISRVLNQAALAA